MKALEETGGDIEASKDYLRKKGLAQAEKRMGRQAQQGLVGVLRDDTKGLVTMIQLACETDFVAKTDKFQDGLRGVLNTLHAQPDLEVVGDACQDIDYIAKLCQRTNMIQPLDSEMSTQNIEEGLKYTIAKTQENVQLVRVLQTTWNAAEGEALRTYVH